MRIFLATLLALVLACTALARQAAGSAWGDIKPDKVQTSPAYEIAKHGPDDIAFANPRYPGFIGANEIRVTQSVGDGFTISSDSDRFRLAAFDSKGRVQVQPEAPESFRSLTSPAASYALGLPPNLTRLGTGVRIVAYVLTIRSADNKHFWLAFALSRTDEEKSNPTVSAPSISPSLSPNQALLDGRTAWTGRLGFGEKVTNLLPNDGGLWTDLNISGTASTDRMDPAASGSAEIQSGRALGANDFTEARLHAGVRGAQSGLQYGDYATLDINQIIPASALGGRNRYLFTDRYATFDFGFDAEQRWKRDADLDPYHVSPSIGYVSAELVAGPFWLFHGGATDVPSFERDWSLAFDLRAYYFPNEESASGFSTCRFESYAGLSLSVPYRVLIWSPTIYYRSGALAGQEFTRSVQFGAELTARF